MELLKLVEIGVPFHRMRELVANPEPFTVRVNPALPAGVDDGLRLLIPKPVGAGLMVKVELLDIAPLLFTVTATVPCAPMRLAPTAPVNWVEVQKIVDRGLPFHKMLEVAVNPEPFTVSVNAASPACVEAGARLLIAGFAGLIVNVELPDVVPVLSTVTAAVPCVAMKLAPMVAVN